MTKERIQKELRKTRQRSYISRDFDGFRQDLLRYARTYFPDKISDFSEASIGGLFLDMNAFVGDNLSYYLDHQFRELNPATAVETPNIESHLRNAGVKIVGASPSVVDITLYIEVYAVVNDEGELEPDRALLPAIRQGSVFRSTSGIRFILTSDIDFTATDENGNLLATVVTGTPSSGVSNGTFILSLNGRCVSGEEVTDSFSIGASFVPFRTVTLTRPNVTEIISVKDTAGNVYYEVDYLTQSNVFREVAAKNPGDPSSLEMIPVPFRYTVETALRTRTSTIRFGSGNAESLDDDIVPDPSEVAMPLYGKSNFSRVSIDPNRLLDTQSLGISPTNTTITVRYRHGGGSNHNVAANSIRSVAELRRDFPNSIDFSAAKHSLLSANDFNTLAGRVINTLDVTNDLAAVGGLTAPTVTELQSRISSSRFLQSRIVTRQDLLARIYSLPARFGRVYRAAVIDNPENPGGAPLVYIATRDASNKLTIASDLLKKNLRLYLNEFRLMSDALDILDCRIINFRIKYRVLIDPAFNKSGVLQKINAAVAKSIKLANFQVGQPIVIDDIRNSIINQEGVISLVDIKFETVLTDESGRLAGRSYATTQFDFSSAQLNGVFIPPLGGIFELKYPSADILGASV
jgi:hypothetical protein